ncbi:NADH-quinone oxidoreductase subunit M [Peribacillus sp. SCS-155]|uniref:NADH-quinone oxidoreductase subunit M n=1 Tax=Peribacillus sedimenti TaxID=3115297 RepID=UPI0039061E4D
MSTFLLTFLVFSPLLGILLIAAISKEDEKNLKRLGILGTIPSLISSLYLYNYYSETNDLSRFAVKIDWITFANLRQFDPNLFAVDYELAIDGFSLIMVILTAVLSTLAAIASIQIKKEWKGYFILLLLLEIGMLGVFTAQNLVLFFIFFEITLIPMFFLIGKWGYLEKERAAYNFLLYNGVGSAILLVVIMILFARIGTTNIEALRHIMTVGGVSLIAPISETMKYGLLLAILAAFGIKLPIFPLHTWMLRVHVQAPPPVVMLHAGVLLKIGAFGLIRFGMGIFPEQFKTIAVFVAVLGVINLLYGAFLALIQNEFKLVMAYSSISHMGIVLIGIGSLNEAGIQGAIFQVVSHGLIAALLFFLIGVMHGRLKTSFIPEISGLAKSMPILSGFLLAGAMASLGLPGMSGFVSEFMAFMGLFKEQPVLAAIGAIGIILTALYLLRAVLSMTFGKTESTAGGASHDINGIEYAPVLVLLSLIIIIGVYPNILSTPLKGSIEAIMLGIGG